MGRDVEHLTLSEIARATGAGKATVKRAIDSGRLSVAMRNDRGQAMIDPAEVLRVWPDADLNRRYSASIVPQAVDGTNGTAELEALRERAERAERALEVERRERAEERARLDAEREKLVQIVSETLPKLLTDQRAEQTERRPWWRRMWG